MSSPRIAPALVVHGGAWSIPDAEVDAHREGCRRARHAGWEVLGRGGSALDAVVEAVAVLEDDPVFNAGRGAHLDDQGRIALDAGVMRGDLAAGAVAAVDRVRHPVRLARAVLERSEAILLVGEAACRAADSWGVETCRPEELIVPRERERHARLRKEPDWKLRHAFDPLHRGDFAMDTVGAVARDAAGGFAAATSTGGAPHKPAGRVGDSPIRARGSTLSQGRVPRAPRAMGNRSCVSPWRCAPSSSSLRALRQRRPDAPWSSSRSGPAGTAG